jgi:pimeloyl-ACP methyl ester carboxylesterase
MIALHGFAHDHHMFNIFQEGLQSHFTVYAIDLPYHGRSQWKEKQYDPVAIQQMVSYILQQENKDQFTALGFSYGARIWMASLPHIQQSVSHLYLLAPDGLRTQWLGLAERTPQLLILLLDQLSKKPSRLIRLADRLRKLGLINRFAHRFVHHHLSTYKHKKRLFCTWRAIQRFRVNKGKVKKILLNGAIQLTVIVGKRDTLIGMGAIKKLVRGVPNAQLHLLNKSHFLIDGSIVSLIR